MGPAGQADLLSSEGGCCPPSDGPRGEAAPFGFSPNGSGLPPPGELGGGRCPLPTALAAKPRRSASPNGSGLPPPGEWRRRSGVGGALPSGTLLSSAPRRAVRLPEPLLSGARRRAVRRLRPLSLLPDQVPVLRLQRRDSPRGPDRALRRRAARRARALRGAPLGGPGARGQRVPRRRHALAPAARGGRGRAGRPPAGPRARAGRRGHARGEPRGARPGPAPRLPRGRGDAALARRPGARRRAAPAPRPHALRGRRGGRLSRGARGGVRQRQPRPPVCLSRPGSGRLDADPGRGARLGAGAPVRLRAHARARHPLRPPAARRPAGRGSPRRAVRRPGRARRARGPRAVRGLELRAARTALPPQPRLLAPRGLPRAGPRRPRRAGRGPLLDAALRAPLAGRGSRGRLGHRELGTAHRAPGRGRAHRPRAPRGGGRPGRVARAPPRRAPRAGAGRESSAIWRRA